MPKRAKAGERNWRVYRMRGKRAEWLGMVSAPSEAEAVTKAIEEFEIPTTLRNRILVRPEE